MSGLELLLLVGLLAAGAAAGVGAVAALVARARRRSNRVVPDVPTEAPIAWAGAHTPLARLHRRLRAAVEAARAVPDPDGALIAARVEVERTALAVDDHLVALHGLAERDRATRMAQATTAVASVEEAAARLADAASASRATALPAVEQALERAALVAEARRELEEDDPAAILGDLSEGRGATRADAAGGTAAADGVPLAEDGDGEQPSGRPSTG